MTSVPGTYRNGKEKRTPGGVRLPAGSRPDEGYGTIVVLTSERGTYTSFWNDIGSAHLIMMAEDPRNYLSIRQSVDICGSLNEAVRGMRGDWLWIMGDDHAFGPDLLPRLLAHNVDVVVPHVLRRNPPWNPVVNSHQDADGWHVAADLPEEGLTEIWSAGDAGMLVRRRVFDAIPDPWFTPTPGSVGLDYDMNFCRLVREAGFRLWCDPGALLGHISNYTVYPRYDADLGGWHIDHVFDQNTRVPIRRLAPEGALA